MAHSMGNQVLFNSLNRKKLRLVNTSFVFAAADVATHEFVQDLEGGIIQGRGAMYCNQNDTALRWSRRPRYFKPEKYTVYAWLTGAKIARAGDCKPTPIVPKPSGQVLYFEAVDHTGHPRSSKTFYHSGITESREVGRDVYLFLTGVGPAECVRNLTCCGMAEKVYYMLPSNKKPSGNCKPVCPSV
jgi:hypothetical protein